MDLEERENCKHCEEIAKRLAKYYGGMIFNNIESGKIVELDDNDDVEKYLDDDNFEQLSLWDCFNDYYNIEYRLDSNKELTSVEIMIACGGPNIYIDTREKKVLLYWWGSSGFAYIDDNVCNEINNIFTEIYSC